MNIIIIIIFFFISLLSSTDSCSLLLQAFSSVSNFQLPYNTTNCANIDNLNLSSKNLTGTVSWMLLANISSLRSIDLSHNSLRGSIPGRFWSSSSSLTYLNLADNQLGGALRFEPSSIRNLNLSRNRFSNGIGVSGLSRLRVLDLSHNSLSLILTGLEELQELDYLDLSCNSMSGVFPKDFPAINTLRYLNVSFNNLTGVVDSTTMDMFGGTAFIKAGSILTEPERHKHKRMHHTVTLVVAVAVSATAVLFIVMTLFVIMKRRSNRKRKGWREEEKGVKAAEELSSWVTEARWGAVVVMFEKPLMELTFSDLAAATSGFSKETQLGDGIGRSGLLYRAVLPGDLNVVVRVVMESGSGGGGEAAAAAADFREMARLRHPNLLPLLGYCIAGKEKLLLYEYMEKGDLHQWLHELPSSHPDSDDWDEDTWEPHQNTDRRISTNDWPTRHKIALGIARGLAFLHQGWAGSSLAIVHEHLVPSNILLDENLEPRIADFANGGGTETMESNVYSYGVLVMELVTGRRKWTADEVEKVRKSVRDGKGLKEVDFRMIVQEGSEGKWETEMVECLRVGYLCTAQSPEKRPKMQQVIGLVKDIRPSTSSSLLH